MPDEHCARVAHERHQRSADRRTSARGARARSRSTRRWRARDRRRARCGRPRRAWPRLRRARSRTDEEHRRARARRASPTVVVPRDRRVASAARTVLGLGEQVDRDEHRIDGVVGDDHDLRRPGVAVDRRRRPGDLALRLGDVRVARARRSRRPRESSRCRRPARRSPARRRRGTPRRPPASRGRREDRVGHRAVGSGRHAQHDLRNTGDPRRERGHQHRRRERRPAARHVAAGAVDRDSRSRGRRRPIARARSRARRCASCQPTIWSRANSSAIASVGIEAVSSAALHLRAAPASSSITTAVEALGELAHGVVAPRSDRRR